MRYLTVYLNFNGDAEEAFEFYRSVLSGEFDGVLRFQEFGDDSIELSEADAQKMAHISLPLVSGVGLMASDVVGAQAARFSPGNSVYLYVEAESGPEADRLFDGVSSGGTVEMPLQATAWAEKYGSLVDRFGVQWMISFTGDVEFSV